MCIAIYKPKGTRILTGEEFENCWTKNKDGFGCMFQKVEGKKRSMMYYKTMDKEKAKDFFDRVQIQDNVEDIAFHFRFATSGVLDTVNCHPFSVGSGMMCMHNGVFQLKDPFGEKSDTAIFSDLIRMQGKGWQNIPENIKQLEKFAYGSKIIFMDKDETFIINEIGSSAHWESGIWFSNYSYVTYKAPEKKTYTYNGSKYNYWEEDDAYEKAKKYNGKQKTLPVGKEYDTETKKLIEEHRDFIEYKSSIQGLLERGEREILNKLDREETNRLWRDFMGGELPSIEERKSKIKEFFEYVVEEFYLKPAGIIT